MSELWQNRLIQSRDTYLYMKRLAIFALLAATVLCDTIAFAQPAVIPRIGQTSRSADETCRATRVVVNAIRR